MVGLQVFGPMDGFMFGPGAESSSAKWSITQLDLPFCILYSIHTEYPVLNAKNVKKTPLEIRIWSLLTLESVESRRAVYSMLAMHTQLDLPFCISCSY